MKMAIWDDNFLTENKYWITRLKFDTRLRFVFYGIFIFVNLLEIICIIGMDLYFSSTYVLIALIILILFRYGLYIGKVIPNEFQKLIASNQKMFLSTKYYKNYRDFVAETFRSRWELYGPLAFGVIYSIITSLFYGFLVDFRVRVVANITIYYNGFLRILNIIDVLVAIVMFILFFLIVLSAFVLGVATFYCLNKMGASKYRLNITSRDLIRGSIEEIGKFIISITIYAIILCTLVGVIGLFSIILFNDYLAGYALITMGIIFNAVLIYLVFRSVRHLHHTLVDSKLKEKSKILHQIQEYLSVRPFNVDKIYELNTFLEEIDNISEWPYSSSSIKKLLVSIGTSMVPLLISFIGI